MPVEVSAMTADQLFTLGIIAQVVLLTGTLVGSILTYRTAANARVESAKAAAEATRTAMNAANAASHAERQAWDAKAQTEEVSRQVNAIHIEVNSKLSQLLTLTQTAAYAEGKLEGRRELDDTDSDPT